MPTDRNNLQQPYNDAVIPPIPTLEIVLSLPQATESLGPYTTLYVLTQRPRHLTF